jgi:hypothetical protein
MHGDILPLLHTFSWSGDQVSTGATLSLPDGRTGGYGRDKMWFLQLLVVHGVETHKNEN